MERQASPVTSNSDSAAANRSASDPAGRSSDLSVTGAVRTFNPITVLICIVATWIVPGFGHWLLGRRGKGLLYASVLTLTFLIGLLLAEFRAVRSDDDFFLYLLGEGLYAGITFPTLWLTGGLALVADYPRLEVGRLFCTVAGIMNLCVMVDVYETAFPRRAGAADGRGNDAAAGNTRERGAARKHGDREHGAERKHGDREHGAAREHGDREHGAARKHGDREHGAERKHGDREHGSAR